MKVVDINQVALGATLDFEDRVLVGGWPDNSVHPLPVKFLVGEMQRRALSGISPEDLMLVYTNKWESADPMPISQDLASQILSDACMLAVKSGYSPNTNSLAGMACPKCFHFGPFDIEVTTTANVTDEGAVVESDIEWDNTSKCRCRSCDHKGVVKEFFLA